MTAPDSTPSPSEDVLTRLMAALEHVPREERSAVVERFQRDHPDHRSAIDEVLAADAQVRPPAVELAGPPRLKAGQRLGPFTVVRFVGEGGMGEVYEAVQDVLHRRVALKVLRRGFARPTARERFVREQRALARLHQTNIVPIHHAGEDGELQYCAMQFVEGASLHEVVGEVLRRESTTVGAHVTPPLREVVGSIRDSKSHIADPQTQTLDAIPDESDTEAKPHTLPTTTFRLSPVYFTTVATLMIQAADAVQHGHDHAICHRDIKPANLMIDATETCYVIDFGLAGAVSDASASEPLATDDARLTHGPLGTPQYMAPERYAGCSEPRSDVWSLGATLYELLALRPAFPGASWSECQRLVNDTEPPDPRQRVRTVPADLVAICRKALAKDPAARYPSARAFADDLRRWSRWEPTSVRPGWATLRPLRLWARRNVGWAVAASLLVLLLGGSVSAALIEARREEARIKDASDREITRLKRDQEAEQEQRRREQAQQRREQYLREATDYNRGEHSNGWSRAALARLDLARALGPGPDLRDAATLTLGGLDARLVASHDSTFGVAEVAVAPDGKRFLLAGISRGDQHDPTRLWDGTPQNAPVPSREWGEGPVAFRTDGTAIQLILPRGTAGPLRLWDVDRQQLLAAIDCPGNLAQFLRVVLSPDGTHAALSWLERDGRTAAVAVWRLPRDAPEKPMRLHLWKRVATALAFSADNQYLAIGSPEGQVAVRDLVEGEEQLRFREGRGTITALAFGRKFWRGPNAPSGLASGLLAVGSTSTNLAVWELSPLAKVNTFRGSDHGILAVTFSPDGTTLASAGRYAPHLWDVASGQLLLRMPDLPQSRNLLSGLVFTPDGRHLVVASQEQFGQRGGVDLWDIDEARGIRTLRGLAGTIQAVWFSASGRWVAGLAHDWQLGLWDAATGRLAFSWELPPGWSIDNADLAFDADERTFVFSAGTQATHWHIATGELIRTWTFPTDGLQDRLAGMPSGAWYLFRGELGPNRTWPLQGIARELDPRRGTMTELYRIGPLPSGNERVLVSGDGRRLFVTGTEKAGTLVRLYDAATGQPIPLNLPQPLSPETQARMSPDGSRLLILTIQPNSTWTGFIHDLGTEQRIAIGPFASSVIAIDAEAKQLADPAAGPNRNPFGIDLYRRGESEPMLCLDANRNPNGSALSFSRDGRFLAWGRRDGTVCVADLNTVAKQVAPYARETP